MRRLVWIALAGLLALSLVAQADALCGPAPRWLVPKEVL